MVPPATRSDCCIRSWTASCTRPRARGPRRLPSPRPPPRSRRRPPSSIEQRLHRQLLVPGGREGPCLPRREVWEVQGDGDEDRCALLAMTPTPAGACAPLQPPLLLLLPAPRSCSLLPNNAVLADAPPDSLASRLTDASRQLALTPPRSLPTSPLPLPFITTTPQASASSTTRTSATQRTRSARSTAPSGARPRAACASSLRRTTTTCASARPRAARRPRPT
jgi:hypothetical protein